MNKDNYCRQSVNGIMRLNSPPTFPPGLRLVEPSSASLFLLVSPEGAFTPVTPKSRSFDILLWILVRMQS